LFGADLLFGEDEIGAAQGTPAGHHADGAASLISAVVIDASADEGEGIDGEAMDEEGTEEEAAEDGEGTAGEAEDEELHDGPSQDQQQAQEVVQR
jgi:hypothetical protein